MSLVQELKRRNVIRMAGLYLVGAICGKNMARPIFAIASRRAATPVSDA